MDCSASVVAVLTKGTPSHSAFSVSFSTLWYEPEGLTSVSANASDFMACSPVTRVVNIDYKIMGRQFKGFWSSYGRIPDGRIRREPRCTLWHRWKMTNMGFHPSRVPNLNANLSNSSMVFPAIVFSSRRWSYVHSSLHGSWLSHSHRRRGRRTPACVGFPCCRSC